MTESEATGKVDRVKLSPAHTDELYQALRGLPSPYDSFEEFIVLLYPIFARLPRELLRKVFNYKNDPEAHGALLLSNFPSDDRLPSTPADGKRCREKSTFVSEGCVLGVAQLLGQPVGYEDEKEGDIIHNLYPVRAEACATSSESSQVSLGFHTDFNYDKQNPQQPFNVVNPDYVVLVCLRPDPAGQARTMYADARDICRKLTPEEVGVLRKEAFQFAASYSFTRKCGDDRIWSVPCPVLKGPEEFPELSVDLLCGVRPLNEDAANALNRLKEICQVPDVIRSARLRPGDVLLMDNRKGAHSRSAFDATFDGQDRWLQRVYVRRSLWELRRPHNNSLRVF